MEEAWSPEVGSAVLLLHKEERHWWETVSGRNIILGGKLLYECTHNSVHIPAEVYKEYLNLLHHAKNHLFLYKVYILITELEVVPLPSPREPSREPAESPGWPGAAVRRAGSPGSGHGRAGRGRAEQRRARGRDGTGRDAAEPGAAMGKLLAVALVGIAAALAAERLLAFRWVSGLWELRVPVPAGRGRGDPRAGSRGAQSVPPRGSAGSLRGA